MNVSLYTFHFYANLIDMTVEERNNVKEMIRKQLVITREKIEKFDEASQPIGPDDAIGRVSRMDAINNKSVIEAALRQARKKMSNLETALKLVDNPDFGDCERCKRPIPTGRLLIMPESKLCVGCS